MNYIICTTGFLQLHYSNFIVPDPTPVTDYRFGTLHQLRPNGFRYNKLTSSVNVHIFVTYTNRVFADTATGLQAAIVELCKKSIFRCTVRNILKGERGDGICNNVNVTVSISGDISWFDYWEAKQRTLRVSYCSQ